MFFDLCTTTILLVEQNVNLVLKVAHRGYIKETDLVAVSDTDDNLIAHDEARKLFLAVLRSWGNY